jgi:NAD(P)H-flavin reductase
MSMFRSSHNKPLFYTSTTSARTLAKASASLILLSRKHIHLLRSPELVTNRASESRAGDWTSNFIDNPPTRIWVKGAPIYGVMRVALMFKKVLVVATGTGIGPCLSLLESCPEHPMHVLWMGSNPRESFGDTIINSVYTADSDACIVDTSKAGRGDILRLAHARYVESQSEAVVIISNAKVTRLVVGGLESRGIPVFGAIFDS